MFNQDFTCPDLLFVTPLNTISYTGLSPCIVGLSRPFYYNVEFDGHWALPLSLAAT